MKEQVKETIAHLEKVVQPDKPVTYLTKEQIEHIVIGSITRLVAILDEIERPWVMIHYIDVLDSDQLERNIKKSYLLDVNQTVASLQCIIKQKYFAGYEDSIQKRIADGSLAKLTYHLKSIL